jgi:hypothetical protein
MTLLITSGALSAPPQQVVRDDGSSPSANLFRTPVANSAAVDFYAGYATGFEAGEGFIIAPVTACPVGFPSDGANIQFQPFNVDPTLNWSTITPGSCATVASGINPAGGVGQHLRVGYDPTRLSGPNFDSARLDARIMSNALAGTLQPPQSGIWTIEFDQAMTGIASDIRIISQDRFGPLPRMWQMVFSSITGKVYYSKGGLNADSQFGDMGVVYDALGVYHHWTIVNDACSGFNGGVNSTTTTTYFLDGVQVATWTGQSGNLELFAPGCVADQMSQIIILSNNFNGSLFDMDNLSISSVQCPHTCGNGILEPTEGCEPGVVECNAGHTCFPADPLDPNQCQCSRICTLADPCILENGDNGDFTPPFDANYGAIFLYFPGALESVAIDTCGTSGYETGILFWGSAGDGVCDISGVDCGAGCPVGETCLYDPGNSNDDCCGDFVSQPWCLGSDSTAPCFDFGDNALTAYSACTCYDIPPEYLNIYLAQIRPTGAGVHVNINKKAVCEGGAIGSCCDSNNRDGDGVGCVDNVLQADCSGPFDTWSGALKCADITCVCIPACDGRNCGDDGCNGVCGPVPDDGNPCTDDTCVDGVATFTNNTVACDDLLYCTVDDVCADGECHGVERVCPQGNGVCDGVERCDEDLDICTNPDDLVCDDGLFCNGPEGCDPDTGCFDNADPCDADTQTCYEDKDDCFDHIIPTVSEWGLVILTLLLLTGAKVYFSRRQATA